MAEVAIRELKNNLSEVIRRVEGGERVVVTVDRRPVAEIVPIRRKRQWIPAREVEALFADARCDRALLAELDHLCGQTIDHLEVR